jgi:cellulose synthase/poly-beta-1,6-N-acetylglucosamine synthase-like glycosyltransferase
MSTLGTFGEIVLCLAAAALLLPAAVVLCETIAALFPGAKTGTPVTTPPPRTALLVPAHNEAIQIETIVRALAADLGAADRLIVIADNCEDETAALARLAGATVIERRDPERRGKGFAVAFGLAHLDADPPDVVVLVDADCQISRGGVPTLAGLAATLNRPIQAEYLMTVAPHPTPGDLISALALLIRNRVRPRGLARLGFPCHLTGSGMAFPWKIVRAAPETGSELVEDLVMGIQLALADHVPRFCPEVQVTASLPDTEAAAMSQRRRWEHGQLHTLTRYVPRLLGAGLLHRRLDLLAMGFDLMVPPLALLVMLQIVVLALGIAGAAAGLTPRLAATLSGAGTTILATAIGIAWYRFGRHVAPLRHALFIPSYVFRKVPLYLSLVVRGKQKTWERTARRGETAAHRT